MSIGPFTVGIPCGVKMADLGGGGLYSYVYSYAVYNDLDESRKN